MKVTEDERLEFGRSIREKMAAARAALESDPTCFDQLSDDDIAAAPADDQIIQTKSSEQ